MGVPQRRPQRGPRAGCRSGCGVLENLDQLGGLFELLENAAQRRHDRHPRRIQGETHLVGVRRAFEIAQLVFAELADALEQIRTLLRAVVSERDAALQPLDELLKLPLRFEALAERFENARLVGIRLGALAECRECRGPIGQVARAHDRRRHGTGELSPQLHGAGQMRSAGGLFTFPGGQIGQRDVEFGALVPLRGSGEPTARRRRVVEMIGEYAGHLDRDGGSRLR